MGYDFSYRNKLYKDDEPQYSDYVGDKMRENLEKMQQVRNEVYKNEYRGNIPPLPTKEVVTKEIPTYGYSQFDRSNAKTWIPTEKEEPKKKLSYKEKLALQDEIKKKKDKERTDRIVNSTKTDYLDRLKNQGKKDADRLTKKVSKNQDNKFYKDLVEPLLMGGLIEPAADIGSILTNNKDEKKLYNDNMQSYKDTLNGVGKVSNTIGSIGANIGMSNALGLDKLKLANNKYLNSAIKEGLENTIIEGGFDLAKGNTDNFLKNRGKDFLGGAAFGVGTNALGDMVRGIKGLEGNVSKMFDDIDTPKSIDTSSIVPNAKDPISYKNPVLRNKYLENAYAKYDNEIKQIQDYVGHYKLTDDEMLEAMDKLNIDIFKTVDEIQALENGLDFNKLNEKYKYGKYAGVYDTPNINKINNFDISNLNALNKPTNAFNSSNANLPLNDKNSIESLLGAKDNINNNTYVEAMNKSDDIFPNEVRKIQNETALTELEDKGLSRHKEVTAANSDVVTDEVKDFMSKYELDYDIKRDKDVIQKAMEEVKKPKAIENFLAYDGKPSAEYVATGEALFKELQSKGDIEGAVNVLNKLSMEGTNLGQSMRMYRMMNGLTPEGKLMYAQRQINNISDEIVKKNNLTKKAKEIAKKTNKKETDVLKELKKKYKVPELTTDDSKFILDTMKKANETTNERQKEILIGKVNKLISEKIPSKGMEKFDSYRYLNMLFNPKTMIKNVGGNVVNATVGVGRDTIGSFIDNLVSKKTGVRTTGVGKSGYFDGLKKGAKETLEDHKLDIDTSHGAREGSKAAALRNIPVLGKAEKLMRTGLQLGDRPFYEAAKQNFINNYMKLNNIDDISKIPGDALEEAHKVGLEATYQQNTALGDAISSLKNKKGVIGVGTKAILPFSQTPSAILDTAINYTLIGAIKGASNINKALKGVDVLSNQRKGVNQLASGILGTGLMYGGYKAAEKGLLTGDLADDYDTRQLQLQTGMQPYAAKVGDTYNSLEFAQPGATPLMMGADIYQNKSLDSVLNTALNSVLSNSYLSGLTDLASKVNKRDGTTDYGAIPKEILKQYGTQSLPFNSLANQINKTIDNTKKDTYSKDEMERFKNQAMSKYPGLSQQLPTKLDSVGQEMQWNEGMSLPMQIFNNFINPSTMSKFEPNKFEKNALDMYNKTGDTSQIPNMPTDSFGYGGYSEYKPTAEEQRLYSTMLADYLSRAENSVEGYSKAKKDAYEKWKAKLVKENNLKKKPKKKS